MSSGESHIVKIFCQLQTALRKAAANFSCCSQTVNISQDDRKKYRETMESRWYFGIGIVSENQNTNSSITTGNPVQLHWQSCVFDEEGGRFIEIKNYI